MPSSARFVTLFCCPFPYSLLDLRLGYDFPRLNLYLRADNLLNRTWYDFGDIPQPGLWIMAGISCKMPY